MSTRGYKDIRKGNTEDSFDIVWVATGYTKSPLTIYPAPYIPDGQLPHTPPPPPLLSSVCVCRIIGVSSGSQFHRIYNAIPLSDFLWWLWNQTKNSLYHTPRYSTCHFCSRLGFEGQGSKGKDECAIFDRTDTDQ